MGHFLRTVHPPDRLARVQFRPDLLLISCLWNSSGKASANGVSTVPGHTQFTRNRPA